MKNKAALTGAMVAFPFTLAPAVQAQVTPYERPAPIDQPARVARPAPGREFCCIKFAERYTKHKSTYTIAGTDREHPIYQNARGEYFYLDPATGDMIFVAPDAFVKWREVVKVGEQVTILGFDEAGHVLQQNARGEMFYLDPGTGDMIFVK